MHGYLVDIVRDGLLIEVQTGGLWALGQELRTLTRHQRVRLVCPIAQDRWVVRLSDDGQAVTGRRKSPKHESVESIFRELVSIPALIADRNFSLEALLIQEEEDIACFAEHSNQLVGFHEVRTRRAGSQRFIDLHLMMPKDTSLEDAHKITDEIEKEIQVRINNTTVVIHVEPCLGECKACQNLGKH